MWCFAVRRSSLHTHDTLRGYILASSLSIRRFSASTILQTLRQVPLLQSWDPAVFGKAYEQNTPARLSVSGSQLPPACSKWFLHDDNPGFDLLKSSSPSNNGNADINLPRSSELRTSFWSEHESAIVPLEVTTKANSSEGFERIEGPLKILLSYLSKPPTATKGSLPPNDDIGIYLAQCSLCSLPESLQSDVPLPRLLRRPNSATSRIKGDIYSSSLWIGRPPTYTPLHRDPNPNFFIQLAGQKTVRLLPPQIGDALYHEITRTLSGDSTSFFSTTIRGDEMMVGPQKAAFHNAIWPHPSLDSDRPNPYRNLLKTHGLETTLGLGSALFIPKGWWHSVIGEGAGVTASVNWWFR